MHCRREATTGTAITLRRQATGDIEGCRRAVSLRLANSHPTYTVIEGRSRHPPAILTPPPPRHVLPSYWRRPTIHMLRRVISGHDTRSTLSQNIHRLPASYHGQKTAYADRYGPPTPSSRAWLNMRQSVIINIGSQSIYLFLIRAG
jgi:hypothetical protein